MAASSHAFAGGWQCTIGCGLMPLRKADQQAGAEVTLLSGKSKCCGAACMAMVQAEQAERNME